MLLAIDGTAAATAPGSVILPGLTVRREALLRARDPFLVARPLVRTHHRRYHHAATCVPAIGPAKPGTPAATKPRIGKRVVAEDGYVVPATRVETGHARTGVGIVVRVLGFGGGARGGAGEGGGGEEEEEEERREGASRHRYLESLV